MNGAADQDPVPAPKPVPAVEGAEVEVRLPDSMPEAWVKQVAEAKSSSLLSTLFGSAVLAALIGLASSYMTARMTFNMDMQKDEIKTKNQQTQDKAKLVSSAYLGLAGSLQDLRTAFEAYVALVGAIPNNKALTDQLNKVGQDEANVIKETQNVNLPRNSSLLPDVDTCLSELTKAVAAEQKKQGSILTHESIDSTLGVLTEQAQQAAFQQAP